MIRASHWSLDDGWRELERGTDKPMRGEFRVFDSGLKISDGTVLLAVDAHGLRHLLVPIPTDFSAAHDRRSGGVHLTTRHLVDDSGQRQYLDLACQKTHLNNIFSHLAEEVLGLLRSGKAQPLQACNETLRRWRELLDKEMSNVLSIESLCGLFGELWHLARMAQNNPQAILAWQGPYGARHDFTVAGYALEIKTTARRDEWKFRVHGLAQLAVPQDARLYLCAMRLELRGASGITVPDLVNLVLQSGVDRRALLGHLTQVGYDPRDDAHYQQIRMEVVDYRLYEITASFPRLTSDSFVANGLLDGVSDVHYTIDLSRVSSGTLDSEFLDHLHLLFAGAHHGAAGPTV